MRNIKAEKKEGSLGWKGTQTVQPGRQLFQKQGMASSVANAKVKLGLRKGH